MQKLIHLDKLRMDFPILEKKIHGKLLNYLDSSATSLTPKPVLDKVNEYYNEYNANIHRALHSMGEKATEEYEEAHRKVAQFINAKMYEVIFTKNATESLNLLAYSLTKKLKKGDEIVVSEMEHHSNLVPWQQLAKEKKLKLKFIKVKDGRLVDVDKVITKNTKIVSVTHISNVLGTINDVKEIGRIAHNNGALMVVDGAQSVPHIKVDVKELNCDFLVFSGHKMLGPTGIGVLYGKEELLNKMSPFLYGGDMILEVKFKDSKWNDLPWKFEAGTGPIAQGIGLGKAVEYLESIGMDKMKEYEEFLTEYALEKLKEIEDVEVYGVDNAKERSGVVSFNIKGIHAHDVSAVLDREGIAVRGGHLCAMPLVTQVLGQQSVVRASFYFYNTRQDIDNLVRGIKKVKEVFHGH